MSKVYNQCVLMHYIKGMQARGEAAMQTLHQPPVWLSEYDIQRMVQTHMGHPKQLHTGSSFHRPGHISISMQDRPLKLIGSEARLAD